MKNINPTELLNLAQTTKAKMVRGRHGFALMQAAGELCVEFERAITGTIADCYFRTANEVNFWMAVEHWNAGGQVWTSFLQTINSGELNMASGRFDGHF
jgi:hypothetical protein